MIELYTVLIWAISLGFGAAEIVLVSIVVSTLLSR